MGQGVFTALPMILAEEAEIDFSRITVVQADNADGTGGSGSVWEGYKPLRQAGAQVREVLIAAAARQWSVPSSECRARNSQVVHTPSGRILSYAALVKDARRLPLPDPNTVPSEGPQRLHPPRPLYSSPRHPRQGEGEQPDSASTFVSPAWSTPSSPSVPTFAATCSASTPAKAKAITGVLDVFEIPTDPDSANKNTREVAVVATNTWAAIQGRNALAIEWKPGQYHDESTESLTAQLRAGLDAQEYWNSTNTTLNPDTVPAAKRIESVYEFPFLAHATMEPMNITVRLEGWPLRDMVTRPRPAEEPRRAPPNFFGIDKRDVTVHVTFMGGGLGRRFGVPFDHQALQIARRIQRPVQLVWTREDDFTHDRYRPACMHRLRGGIDRGRKPCFVDRPHRRHHHHRPK